MNYTKLLSIIKTSINEAHHSARYGGTVSGRPNQLNKRGIPNKTPQLAETKKEKKKEITGRTETGQIANKIELEPNYNSQIEPIRGPSAKSSLDTK